MSCTLFKIHVIFIKICEVVQKYILKGQKHKKMGDMCSFSNYQHLHCSKTCSENHKNVVKGMESK